MKEQDMYGMRMTDVFYINESELIAQSLSSKFFASPISVVVVDGKIRVRVHPYLRLAIACMGLNHRSYVDCRRSWRRQHVR
jgi:hypothetical protein